MRIKITMDMSGSQFLDLLRRVPKSVAQELKNSAVILEPEKHLLEEKELFGKSAEELVDAKKR